MISPDQVSLVERVGSPSPGYELWLATVASGETGRSMELFSENALHAHARVPSAKNQRGSAHDHGRRVHAKLCAQGNRGLEARAALLVQARLLHCLGRHPNVLDLTAVVAVGEPLMYITPLMAGGTLRSYMKTRKTLAVPVADKHRVMTKVASAMAYLESLSIVHRALSLDAVMVGDSLEDVKLTNFGVSAAGAWLCKRSKCVKGANVSKSKRPRHTLFHVPLPADMARDIYESGAYKVGDSSEVKARTWAIESLEDDVFTSKSDVWSFAM